MEHADTVGLPVGIQLARGRTRPVGRSGRPAAGAAVDDAVTDLVGTIPILHKRAGLSDNQVDLVRQRIVLNEASRTVGQRQHRQAIVGQRAVGEEVVDPERERPTSRFRHRQQAIELQVAGHDHLIVQAATQRIGLTQFPIEQRARRQIEIAVDRQRARRVARGNNSAINQERPNCTFTSNDRGRTDSHRPLHKTINGKRASHVINPSRIHRRARKIQISKANILNHKRARRVSQQKAKIKNSTRRNIKLQPAIRNNEITCKVRRVIYDQSSAA